MTREELFESYKFTVKLTIDRFFGSEKTARRIASENGADYEDYLQVGYMTLWQITSKHDPSRKAFYYFATRAIKLDLMTFIRRKSSLLKLPDDKAVELKKCLAFSDIIHFEEILPSYYNVENYVVNKVELENRMKALNDLDKKIIKLSMQGYRDREIGQILDKKEGFILCRRNRSIKKMAG